MYVVPDAAPVGAVNNNVALVEDIELAELNVGASNVLDVVVKLTDLDAYDVPALFVAVAVK